MSTLDTTTEKPSTGNLRVAFALGGLIALAAGILVLVWPGHTILALTWILGVYLIASGVVFLATGAFNGAKGGWARLGLLLLGVLYLVVGIGTLRNLGQTAAFLTLFLVILVGVTWIVEGFVALFTLGEARSKAATGIFAVLSILAGAVLFVSPVWGAIAFWWFIGISLVVLGVMQLVRAITWKG